VTSIFQRALGADYERLHPRLQQRFAMSAASGTAQLGHGVMTSMTRSPLAVIPVLAFGARRRLELPGTGRHVPFDLANYAYLDSFGRDTFAYSRRFQLPGQVRRFDDTMIYSEQRRSIVNYLGSHQDVAAELRLEVTPQGWMRMIGGAQRLYLGAFGIPLPGPMAARAEVLETVDGDRFTISVDIGSAVGRLVSYRGWFVMREEPFVRGEVPPGVLPDRERQRD
jgi:hypothetical protein